MTDGHHNAVIESVDVRRGVTTVTFTIGDETLIHTFGVVRNNYPDALWRRLVNATDGVEVGKTCILSIVSTPKPTIMHILPA